MKSKMKFKKECRDCNNMFRPNTRAQKVCDNCWQKAQDEKNERNRIRKREHKSRMGNKA